MEDNKKQTAIKWLLTYLPQIDYGNDPYYKEIIEQAKEMEKEQHGNTWDKAIYAHEQRGHVIARSIVDFDEYYNETYK